VIARPAESAATSTIKNVRSRPLFANLNNGLPLFFALKETVPHTVLETAVYGAARAAARRLQKGRAFSPPSVA
jgi:hypothetical protein